MKIVGLVAFAAALAATSGAANAAVVVNITQSGSSVVSTTSGSLDLTGLSDAGLYSLSRGINPGSAYVSSGATEGALVRGYTGLTGPASFGSGNYITASSGTGAGFALNGSDFGRPYVFVANGYTSGTSFTGTSTFANQTFASLGLTTGSYVYRSAADTVTVNIGNVTPAVPEPATWAMMLVGFGGIGFAMRRRKSKVTTTVAYA